MKKNLLLSTSLLWLGQSFGQCPTPTLVTANPSVICVGATTSLNATAVGSSISWYTVPVGGVSTGTSASGANFAVSPVTTTTYYAESFVVGTPSTQVFSYTGAMQTFTVPAGVSSLTIVTKGAEGQKGANTGGSLAGKGGVASGVAAVIPGQVYNIFVGGQAGFNGGGNYWGNVGLTCRGGDASDVRFPGNTIADRIIVAGGGGGVSGESAWGSAGNGGGGIVVGTNFVGGQGGSGYNGQTAGNGGTNGGAGVGPGAHNGAGGGGGLLSGGGGGTNNAYATAIAGTGSLGLGGAGNAPGAGCCQTYGCAGGGGGYYGGGGVSGGCCGGGGAGGGSSWTGTLTSPSFTAGTQVGNGQVTISYIGLSCTSASRTAVVVTVNPNPTITVNSGTVCSGNSFTMVPSGANTYTFQGGNAVVSPTVNTNYTVVGTSTAGCVSQAVTSSVTINASPLPTITVNSGSICSGQSFTINPSGANTYTIQGGNAVITPTATGAYTVVGTSTAGCVSGTFATSNVTVNAVPSVSVTGNSTICVGESATLTASGANSYSWNTGASTSSIVVSPTVTTSYTAVGTSSAGCSNSGVMSLVVSPCTGVTNNNSAALNGLSVYPNPSNGDFVVELKNGLSKNITITDINGKVVLSTTTSKDMINVNLTAFANGIYNVKIESNNATQVVRVVKQ